LTKLWAFKDGKKAPYRNPSSFDQVMGFKRCKHIEIRVLLTKLWTFKDVKKVISVNLRKIKINDIKTIKFFTTFKVVYINADKNIIIPKAHKDVPYRNPRSFDQVMGF